MDKNYKQFVDKLNSYIKKFYFFQLIRGLFLFVVITVAYFSFISILEYFNYFDPVIKSGILITTLFLTVVVFIYFLVIPSIKLVGIGKQLTYFDVSSRLQKTFPEIKDKLINIVELENEENSSYSNELKRASIDQKISELNLFSFSDAIQFKDLKIVFILFSTVIILFSVLFISSPYFIKDSSVRLIHFKQKFEKPAPYTFHLENKKMEIVSGESVELHLICSGKNIPETMYINIGGSNFLMTKDIGFFKYIIENLNSSISIYFTDKEYLSDIYKISVINKPFISSFSVNILPPVYTNLSEEKFENIGDIKVTSGTIVKWIFETVDTDSLVMLLNDGSEIIGKRQGKFFEVTKTIYKDTDYKIAISNSKLAGSNNLVYKIQTTSDLFPEIKIVQVRDTIDYQVFHFKGNIRDDYGFSQLYFNLNTNGKDSLIKIPFTPYLLNQDFYYSFSFDAVKSFGNSFKYYFSVYDNDFINHFKRSVSETFSFSFPEYKDIVNKENSDQSTIDLLFKKSVKLTEEIQQEFKDFKMKQINSQLSDYEKFEAVKDIINKKVELEDVLDKIKQQNKEANNFLNSFSENKQEVIDKQKQIEELLNEVFSDDLKKLFDEFNELAKKFDSKKFDQISKKIDSNLDDLSEQLDRNVQLLKKMKLEQKIERIVEQLNGLSKSELLNFDNLNKRSDLKEINEREGKNSSLLDNLNSDYNGALDFNKSLDKPMNLIDFTNEFSVIKKNYLKILDDSNKGNKRKTATGIESNKNGIDQLSFAIDQMLKNNKKKENKANIADIKQILENLIFVSFDQEKLLDNYSIVDFNNPMINNLKIDQKNLNSQVEFVKDSLYALAKRIPELGSVINKEMLGLENSVDAAFDNIDAGNLGGTRMYQQYGITSANNLSLYLSEALENIKKQEKNSQPGDGDCDKPGGKGSKPSMSSLKESQNSIKEQLQKMIDQMKNGDTGNMSKSIGQTLAQQEVMQQLIRDMLNGNSVGSKAGEQLKLVERLLEESKKELINRNITNELVNRQNLILSKLLDAEKSEIERDFEDKRESKTAIDLRKTNPEGYFEYKDKIKNENELLKRGNMKLRSFYDLKYNSFLNQIKN